MQPVVFLHGLIGPFCDERAVAHLRPAVVLNPDLLGYGAEAGVNPGGITIGAQVEYVRAVLDDKAPSTGVHLVGHSAGGVVAASFAHRYPDRVDSFVSVEGNFTLADAFWSGQVSAATPAQVTAMLEADRADPARWLRESGVAPTGDRIRSAAEALAYQPASTIQATACAVVQYTGLPGYERLLKEVFDHTAVHLVAGARSRAGWDVPEWALTAAASYTEVADAGHMVMLEAPDSFGKVLAELIAGPGDRGN
jgi:pimeloyl-ACP methyl ester carboxylesterase